MLPRYRRAPRMPLLPTTIRSAPTSAAVDKMTSSALPCAACASAAKPSAYFCSASSPTFLAASSSSAAPAPESMSGAPVADANAALERGGRVAVTICSSDPQDRAISAAASTALFAVSVPSVPTTSTLYMVVSLVRRTVQRSGDRATAAGPDCAGQPRMQEWRHMRPAPRDAATRGLYARARGLLALAVGVIAASGA